MWYVCVQCYGVVVCVVCVCTVLWCSGMCGMCVYSVIVDLCCDVSFCCYVFKTKSMHQYACVLVFVTQVWVHVHMWVCMCKCASVEPS